MPLSFRDGVGSEGPRHLDQLFESGILRFRWRPDLYVACSFAAALKQVILVIESGAEQESDRDMCLHGRKIAYTSERSIVNRVVDCVIVEEFVRSGHCASSHLAQFSNYPSYLLGIT